MNSKNESPLQENISDETIKEIYESAFKKRGVSIKSFVIEHDIESSVDYFNIGVSMGIHFWIKWHSNVSMAHIISVANGEESDIKEILNPNANNISDYIALEYKKIISKQSIIKKILSLILEEDENSNRNPLLK